MKNITIKKDKALIALSILLRRSPDLLIESILKVAQKYDYVIDDLCEAGTLLIDQAKQTDDISNDALCVLHTGSHDMKIIDLFSKLKLWGRYDCPKCGCESEESELYPNVYRSMGHDSPPEIWGEDHRTCISCGLEFTL